MRLYIDAAKGTYWLLPFSDARKTVEVPITTASLENAKRGIPFECWLAVGIETFAKKSPESFPHPVRYAYAIRSAIYLVDRFKNGQPSHAIRYFHDSGSVIGKFDGMSKQEFIKLIDAEGFTLKMRPATKGGHVEPHTGVRRPTRDSQQQRRMTPAQKAISNGAKRRAIEAGLIHPTA